MEVWRLTKSPEMRLISVPMRFGPTRANASGREGVTLGGFDPQNATSPLNLMHSER
jgi:hypothetical protein